MKQASSTQTHENGLTVALIQEYFFSLGLKKAQIYWKKEPRVKGACLIDAPAGYQSRTKVQGRTYEGNVFINFQGRRITAQEVAWVLYHKEFPADHLRIIHLDGDRTNQHPENLHLQPKPGQSDLKIES